MSEQFSRAISQIKEYVVNADHKLEKRLDSLESNLSHQKDNIDSIKQTVESLDSFVKNLIISLLVAIIGLTGVAIAFSLQKVDTKNTVAIGLSDRIL